jgi:hypothetical protein
MPTSVKIKIGNVLRQMPSGCIFLKRKSSNAKRRSSYVVNYECRKASGTRLLNLVPDQICALPYR